ncbi:MAG TPA: hypothetical protein VEX61_12970 [Burkholderiales bacterium]|nr:hypothetical protein [Burkholderiales bacterium]
MDGQQLKALQAPIKERYKQDPGAAVVTLRAEGRIGTIRNAPPVVVVAA